MKITKQITIEAVPATNKCSGCLFDSDLWSKDGFFCPIGYSEFLIKVGLPDCGEGYIYRLKEEKLNNE